MGGKVFLNRNLKKGSSTHYYKYFLWAAIGLVFLVVITPLITHRRSDKATSKKVIPENGMVVKEIPRSSPSDSGAGLASQEASPVEGIKESNLEPGPTVSQGMPQVDGGGQPSNYAESPTGASGVPPGGTPTEQPQVASITEQQSPTAAPETDSTASPNQNEVPTAVNAPVKPPESAPAESAVPLQETSSAPPQQASVAPSSSALTSPKKPVSAHTTRYIVQIGSFAQRQNADNIQQSLIQKGYEVIVRTINHAKFGKLYVVQLAPVNDAQKAESLMTNVRKEANIKPIVVRVPAEQ